MEKSPFTYEVAFYIGNGEYAIDCGIGFAGSYKEAAHLIEEHYRSDLSIIKRICMLEESTLLPLDKTICRRIERNEYWAEHEKHKCDEFGNELVMDHDELATKSNTSYTPEPYKEDKTKRKTLDVNFSIKPANAMETFGKGR